MLLSGAPVHIDEVAAATGINAHTVAHAPLEAGICAELTPDLATGYQAWLASRNQRQQLSRMLAGRIEQWAGVLAGFDDLRAHNNRATLPESCPSLLDTPV